MQNISVVTALIALGVSIGLFFLLRDIYLWYFRINKRIELMEETNRLLQELINNRFATKQVEEHNTKAKV